MRQLAQLYLYHAIPYRAAGVLEKGLADELVEEHSDVFAMLANSWLLAREYDAALEPLKRAAEMSTKGTLFVRLGQVLLDRERWDDAGDALAAGLEKGELSDRGSANLMLGIAHFHQSHMASARKYFAAARDGETSKESAVKWLQLLDREAQAG